jgi:hypothetical protein
MNKEILYDENGHAIDPKQYAHWTKLSQSEKNNLYARYIFLCEQER